VNSIETALAGAVILEPRVFGDARGYFLETWNQARYAGLGLPERFVQDNLSSSTKGVLRGLHYQIEQPQGKLVRVVTGEVFDVVIVPPAALDEFSGKVSSDRAGLCRVGARNGDAHP